MARLSIPLEAFTSRINLGERFANVRAQSLGSRFANLRPMSEFLDLKRLSKPHNFGEMQSRVNYNLGHFSSNYSVVFVMLIIYSLLTNLLLLFVILLVVGGMYGIGKLDGRDLDLLGFHATTSQLYTGLVIVSVPLGFWAYPVATVLWLIGATGVTILGHASFMDKPIENAFSEEAGWEQQSWNEPRFEEVDDSDDESWQGVELDLSGKRRHVSDDLHFTGVDLGTQPRRRKAAYDEDSESSDDDEQEHEPEAQHMQLMLREKEDFLVERAVERIERARKLGKPNVKLSPAEVEALERAKGIDHGKDKRKASRPHAEERRRSRPEKASSRTPSKALERRKSKAVANEPSTFPAQAYPPITYPQPHYGASPPVPRSRPSSSRTGSRTASSQSLRAQVSHSPPLPQSPYPPPAQAPYPNQAPYPPTQARYFSNPSPSPYYRPDPSDPNWAPRARSTSNLGPTWDPSAAYPQTTGFMAPGSQTPPVPMGYDPRFPPAGYPPAGYPPRPPYPGEYPYYPPGPDPSHIPQASFARGAREQIEVEEESSDDASDDGGEGHSGGRSGERGRESEALGPGAAAVAVAKRGRRGR